MDKQRFVSLLIFILSVFLCSFVLFSSKDKTALYEANIESLCEVEHGSYVRCYKSIISDPADTELYCSTCTEIPGRIHGGMSYCKPNK